MFNQTGLKIPKGIGKIQDPKPKNQTISNNQISKYLSKTGFRHLDIGILEFTWNLVLGSWNFGLHRMWV
jgi:hypothetical protein